MTGRKKIHRDKLHKINEKKIAGYIPTLLKYGFSAVLTFMAYRTVGEAKYLFAALAELALIIAASDCIMTKKPRLAIVINDLLTLFYNIQMLVMFFGNSYVILAMLDNLGLLEDLSGKAAEYGFGTVLMLIFSLLPIKKIKLPPFGEGALRALCGALALELCLTMAWGNGFSPFYAYFDLAAQKYKIERQRRAIAESGEDMTAFFHSVGIQDFRKKSESLGEKPNVILVMAEGLSSNIIYDERDIMPKTAELMKRALNFTDYYNHTFATYRGIIGQLYSGYQDKNLDTNSLVSLQDILKNNGYNTAFINTEPYNTQFAEYLDSLNFDEVIGTTENECRGLTNSISDKDAFDLLFGAASEKESVGEPFFITMYTFGTHASFNSVDEKFGDGGDRLLNKFHNLDCQLGAFVDRFENSSLSDNTIFIFTADHATYADNDFINSFPDYKRVSTVTDEMPLIIYHKGIEAEEISAGGRNTLDLAPTVCDYLDISEANYFLGCSLFAPKQNNNSYDTVFFGDVYYDTDGDAVAEISQSKREIVNGLITKYFTAKLQTPVQ